MSSAIPFPLVTVMPSGRGRMSAVSSAASVGVCRLPTDAIGTFTLTLTNLVVGSVIEIQDQALTTSLHNSTAGETSKTIVLQAYAAGSPLNSLLIKVRKGSSSPYYQPYETQTTAFVGSQSIYVSQIPDE